MTAADTFSNANIAPSFRGQLPIAPTHWENAEGALMESLESQSTMPTIAEITEAQSNHQVPESSYSSLVAFAAAAVAAVAGGRWRRRAQAANNKVRSTFA